MRLAIVICTAVMLLGVGNTFQKPGSVYRLLCPARLAGVTDMPEYTLVRSMQLEGNRLTVDVELGLRSWEIAAYPNAHLSNALGMAYSMDGNPAVTVGVSGQHATSIRTRLAFLGLSRGHHRIRIGLANKDGAIFQDTGYCFSAPGHFSLTGNLYI